MSDESQIRTEAPSFTTPDDAQRPAMPFGWSMLPKSWQRILIVVMLLSGVSAPIATRYLPLPANASQPTQQQIVTRADYEILKLGMTVTDAQARLGRAIEQSRDEATVTYKWTNADGAELTAVFKGDRLISKQQTGLK
jgi:hypothetical protein